MKFGKRNRPSIPKIGCCRWKFSRSSTRRINSAELKTKIEKFLNEKKAKTKDLSTLISWGFRLVDYHKKPEYQATLEASPKYCSRVGASCVEFRIAASAAAATTFVIPSEVEESRDITLRQRHGILRLRFAPLRMTR